MVVNQHFYTVPYFFFACGAISFFPYEKWNVRCKTKLRNKGLHSVVFLLSRNLTFRLSTQGGLREARNDRFRPGKKNFRFRIIPDFGGKPSYFPEKNQKKKKIK